MVRSAEQDWIFEKLVLKPVKNVISSGSNKRLQLAISFCMATVFCYLLAAGMEHRLNNVPILQKDGRVVTMRREAAQQKEKLEELTSQNQLYLEYLNMTENLERNSAERKKRFPDVIGIGVEKCGTGALRWMLVQHPMIIGSDPNELHFFDSRKYEKGLEYYKSLMPEVANYELAFEKTPGYFVDREDLPQVMKRSVPNAKVIVVLCDPVNRTFSDFVQETLMGNIPEGIEFETMIYQLIGMLNGALQGLKQQDDDDATMHFIQKMYENYHNTHVITAGMYYYHLRRWLKEYKDGEIHIIDGSELIQDPGSAMEKVQDFLGIPKLITKDDFVIGSFGFYCIRPSTVNRTSRGLQVFKGIEPVCMKSNTKGRTRNGNWKYRPSDISVQLLREFYEPYNEKLFQLLGRDFNWQRPQR